MRHNVIIIMSLSGTLVVALYYLLYPVLAKYMGALWRYRFLKIALLFYLFPFPKFKYNYIEMLETIFGYQNIPMAEHVPQMLNRAESIITDPTGQVAIPEIAKRTILLTFIFACCSLIIIVHKFYQYFKMKHILMQCGPESEPSERITEIFIKAKEEINFGRTIKIVLSPQAHEPMTLGVIAPAILLPDRFADWEEENLYFVLKHELAHIKHGDLVFKFAGLIAMAVHWFNPFCILLYKELSETAEICCDKQVLAGRREADRKKYGTLLIDMAAIDGASMKHKMLLSAGFIGNDTKRMKRRVHELKKKERVNKAFAGIVLVSVFQMAFATAVFAYVPFPTMEVEDSRLNPDMVWEAFIPGETRTDVVEDLTMGGVVFVEDKTGVIYHVAETEPKASCNHNYVSGEKQVHEKNSNGGCTVDIYHAQRCTRCGDVKMGDWSRSVTYGVCPH